MNAPDDLMTVNEVRERLRVGSSTPYTWRSRGEGPKSFRLGGRVVYERADVEAWIAAQKQATSRGTNRQAS